MAPGVTLFDHCRTRAHDECCRDPCGFIEHFNSGVGALNYVQYLEGRLRNSLPSIQPRFIVDTGRNGAQGRRRDCRVLCNMRSAAFGRQPTNTTDMPAIDAYFWIRPPGLSDGCRTETGRGSCPHPNPDCGHDEAFGTRNGEDVAPEAGHLYVSYMQHLAGRTTTPDAPPRASTLEQNALEAAELSAMVGTRLVLLEERLGLQELPRSTPSGTHIMMSALVLMCISACVAVISVLLRKPSAYRGGDNSARCDDGCACDEYCGEHTCTSSGIGSVKSDHRSNSTSSASLIYRCVD